MPKLEPPRAGLTIISPPSFFRVSFQLVVFSNNENAGVRILDPFQKILLWSLSIAAADAKMPLPV